MNRHIQPLGDQIIIKTIPVKSVGSLVLPDSASRTTVMDPGKPMEAVHFVEAEVIAVGQGKRTKGDKHLVLKLADALKLALAGKSDQMEAREIGSLLLRAENGHQRLPLLTKPGDRILYHPSVQKFDRDITDLLSDGSEPSGTKYYIISEETSGLAVIER